MIIIYDIIDVAKYVVDYEYTNGRLINLLRLQRVLYFIQCEYLANQGKPCFEEDFHSWPSGPVSLKIHYEYRRFGGLMTIYSKGISDNIYNIQYADIKIIEDVLNACALYSTSQLMELSRNQEPWKQAYDSIDKIITKKSIINFFDDG